MAVNLDSARFLHGLGWEWKGITMGPKDRPFSPVFLAAAYGSEANLVFWVDELAYPLNMVVDEGVTLLKIAIHRDDVKIAAFLLSRGANPATRDKDGRSAADFAKSREMRELLDRHGKENVK